MGLGSATREREKGARRTKREQVSKRSKLEEGGMRTDRTRRGHGSITREGKEREQIEFELDTRFRKAGQPDPEGERRVRG